MAELIIPKIKINTRICLVCETLEIEGGQCVQGFAWLCDNCKEALKNLVEKERLNNDRTKAE